VQEHACILNALRSRDPREAERAMRHHIDEAFELIRDYRSEPAHIKQARRGTPLKPLTRKPARNV